jgi:hypothetical protein
MTWVLAIVAGVVLTVVLCFTLPDWYVARVRKRIDQDIHDQLTHRHSSS